MPGPSLEIGMPAVLETAVGTSPSLLYVVNPGERGTRETINALSDVPPGCTVRLLADEKLLKSVFENFVVASSAAEMIADDRLVIRTVQRRVENSVVLTDQIAIALLEGNNSVNGLATTEARFVESLVRTHDEQWEAADAFSLRTPPLRRVQETLAADMGSNVREDFDAILTWLERHRDDGRALDAVTASLVVAARHEQLLYDISKWGEDVGIASKATFSRTKTRLEEHGILDTEKVPIDVGRPRLRLQLDQEDLIEAPGDQLAERVMNHLSA